MTDHKKCSKCKKYQSRTCFSSNKKSKDRLESWCKACKSLFNKSNAVTISKANKQYFQNHKEDIKRLRRERYGNDLQFRISCNIRNRINKLENGKTKKGPIVKDLGCTIAQLKDHLQNQFVDGMSWDNYGFGQGKWNIVHITPPTNFNLNDEGRFLKTNHYLNLRPLWNSEKIKKVI